MSDTYDVVIIGAGPGGFAAALEASRLGAHVALVEKVQIGGVCLNWGCIPTKTLIAGVEVLKTVRDAAAWGIDAPCNGFDLSVLMARKNAVVENLRNGMLMQLKRAKIALIEDEACIGLASSESHHTINLRRSEKSIYAKNIIVATGSVPRELPDIHFDRKTVLSSRDILTLEKLPRAITIIGGGVIGCECAHILNGLGVEVTLFEMAAHLLPCEDAELGKRLAVSFKKRGIVVHVGKMCAAPAATYDTPVLIAIGRSQDTLALCGQLIDKNENGTICVNDYLQCSVRGIYAIGDCIDSPQLAHMASYEGIVAARNALRDTPEKMRYDVVPNCVYVKPEIASVGLTLDKAKKAGLNAVVSKILFSAIGKAQVIGSPEGFLKLVYDMTSKKVLGAQIMGPSASDIIAEIALCVRHELTVDAIAETIHAHPSLSEIVFEAAHGALD